MLILAQFFLIVCASIHSTALCQYEYTYSPPLPTKNYEDCTHINALYPPAPFHFAAHVHCLPTGTPRIDQYATLREYVEGQLQTLPNDYISWHAALQARLYAMQSIHNTCATCAYVLSSDAQELCTTLAIGELAYTQQYSRNSFDAVLHQEACTILEHAAQMANHPHLAHMHWLAQSIAQVNDAGLTYTKAHSYQAALHCFDWCWAALSTVPSLIAGTIDGVQDGVYASLHTLTHPVETIRDFAHSIALLGWYTAQLLMQATITHDPIADRMRAQKICDDAQSLQTLADTLYHEAYSLSAYGAARMVSATLVEQVATGKLLHGIASFIKRAVSYTKYLHSMPSSLPATALPVARALPHGYHNATQDGIELYLSYLDWAGDNPRKAAPKLRGFVSKSQYLVHCERVQARALPTLIETARKLDLKATAGRIAHVIWGELRPMDLGGCHSLSGLKLHRFEHKFLRMLPGKAYKVEVKVAGKWIEKSIFPAKLSPNEVLRTIHQALQNCIVRASAGGNRYCIIGKSKNGVIVESIFEADGSLVTAFPVDKNRLQKVLDGMLDI